jgi:cell division septation protein DedD
VEAQDLDSTTVAAVAANEPVGPIVEADLVPVEPRPTWRAALVARLRPDDHHVSDEDIFAILNGGCDGVSADDLCAARGVTLLMFCVWKSKYRRLDLQQLRQARRREQRRRHALIGGAALTVLLLTGGIGASLVWAVASTLTGAPASPAASAPPPRALRSVPAPVTTNSRPTPAGAPAPAAALASTAVHRQPVAAATPAIFETGYRIQVTAAESESQGRAFVERLVSQGHSAYMVQALVGDREVFRVRVGPFDTLPAAQETATQLKSAGYGGVWIARD